MISFRLVKITWLLLKDYPKHYINAFHYYYFLIAVVVVVIVAAEKLTYPFLTVLVCFFLLCLPSKAFFKDDRAVSVLINHFYDSDIR